MIYLAFVVCSCLCLAYAQFLQRKSGSVVRSVVFSVVFYFGLYTVISGVLFWIGQFSVKRAVIAVFLVSTIVCVFSFIKKGIKEIQIEAEKKEAWIPYIAILFLCIFSAGHFEYFGMWQDQGVYQTEAINLFYDLTDWRQSISEYDELEEGEYKEYYQDEVGKLAGYDLMIRCEGIPGCKVDETTSKVLGMWHGIPTFAGILALSAKMFGIEHMMYVQALFFVCFLFVVGFLLEDWKIGVCLRTLLLILLGISPQMIWVKKSSLTEMFLALLIAVYLYFILNKDNSKKTFAVFPVMVFCFYHITIFTMMPMFVLVFWGLYFSTGDKGFLKCTGAILASYAAGFFMMWAVQPQYTLLNYHQGLLYIPQGKMIPILVVAICVITGIATAALGKITVKTVDMEKFLKWLFRYSSIFVALFSIFYFVLNHYTFSQIRMTTISCYCVLTGIFLLPVVWILFVFKKYSFDSVAGILGFVFLWCILIYSTLMRRDVHCYYYYGRYLVPYLCVIVLLFAYLMKDKRRYIASMLSLIGILVLLPFANVLRVNQDDSIVEWSVLSDVIETVKGAHTVFVDTDLMHLFYFPVRASLDGNVYPVKDDLNTTLCQVPLRENCLYITKNPSAEDNCWLRNLYRNTTYFQEDNVVDYRSRALGLLTSLPYKGTYDIMIYQVESETESILAGSDHAGFEGWANEDPDGCRWTNAKEASVKCYLNQNDYTMTIRNGHEIPFGQIKINEISVKVYLNGHFVQTMCYTPGNSGMDQEIKLPAEWVLEGSNQIKFESDAAWSPSEYGSEDPNEYGFSIREIVFEKKK